jgi:translation initiation factor 3 subunit L
MPLLVCRNTAAHQLILQKNEQIYMLLAIAVAMCPSATRWLEENVREQLQFKCADILFEMQSSNLDAFKKAFGAGCPKFVTAAPPDLSEVGKDNNLAGYHESLRLFLAEVRTAAASC